MPYRPFSLDDPEFRDLLNPPERSFGSKIGSALSNTYNAIEEAPSFWANYNANPGLRRKALRGDVTPIPELVEDIVAPPDEAAQSYPLAIGRKVAGTVAGMAMSPTNIALAAATGGLGAAGVRGLTAEAALEAGGLVPEAVTAAEKIASLGKYARLGSRVASLGFAGQMVPGAYEKIGQGIGQVQREGFTPNAVGELAGGGIEAAMAAGALKHGLSPTKPFGPPRTIEEAVEQRQATLQRPSFLDDLGPAPDYPEAPLGYGRGGIPAGQITRLPEPSVETTPESHRIDPRAPINPEAIAEAVPVGESPTKPAQATQEAVPEEVAGAETASSQYSPELTPVETSGNVVQPQDVSTEHGQPSEVDAALPLVRAALDKPGPSQKGGLVKDATGKVVGVSPPISRKVDAGLDGLEESPKRIVQAIDKDADNPLYLKVREKLQEQIDDRRGGGPSDAQERSAIQEETAGDTSFEPEKYSVRPSPGQQGLEGIGSDIPLRENGKKAPPAQESMFGGEMLQGTERLSTEGREAEGSLFTQERDRLAKEEAGRQTSILEPPTPSAEPKADSGAITVEKAGDVGDGKDTAERAKFATAFHGSPHDFDKFDSSKIGTGEGAQAYGHGLYFSSKREIAQHYKDRLSSGGDNGPGSARDWISRYGSKERALEAARANQAKDRKHFEGRPADLAESQLAWEKTIASLERGAGKLYEVDLAPKEEDYLLWDKPLSEQSESVKAALDKLGVKVATPEVVAEAHQQYVDAYNRYREAPRPKPGESDAPLAAEVEQSYKDWMRLRDTATMTGKDAYRDLGPRGDAAASNTLREAGIPGIKYLDGSSRNKPLRDIKREFLAELPENASVEDVAELIGTGKFSPANDAILKALKDDDWLGFDYPAQALSAALGKDLPNYEASPALVKAISAAQEGGSHNYVIFDDSQVTVKAKYAKERANLSAQPTLDLVRQRFRDIAHVKELPEQKSIVLRFKDGLPGTLQITEGEVRFNPGNIKHARPMGLQPGRMIAGSFQKMGTDGLIRLKEGMGGKVLGHEELHFLLAMGRLREGEIDALWKAHGYNGENIREKLRAAGVADSEIPTSREAALKRLFLITEEKVADTVGKLIDERLTAEREGKAVKQPSWFERLWSHLTRLWDAFQGYKGDTAESALERIASKEVYKEPSFAEKGAFKLGEVARGAFSKESTVNAAEPKFAAEPFKTLKDLRDHFAARGIDNFVGERGDTLTASRLVVPKDQRGQGIGSEFMRALTEYADANGKTVALSPSIDFGASSVNRLRDFYKRFGFVENKGRHKDFRISESMIREPQTPKFATAPKQPPLPGVPEPPKAPEAKEGPLGRPMIAGEAHRVDTKVANLKEVVPEAKLSRDAPRTWESLDPQIREKLNTVLSDPSKEQFFYEKARTGKLNDVEVQTLDALVRGKREAYDSARERLLKAQEAGTDTGPENVHYLRAAFDQVAADLANAARSDVEAGTKLARALAARARVMEAAGTSTPDQFLRRIFREIPDVSDAQAAALLRVLQEKPQDLGDALNAALKPGRLDKWLEFWKAGLVSAPGTQVANVLGNTGDLIMRLGETVTASALDPLLGGPKTRLRGEARFELAGALKGAGDSFGKLRSDLKDIFTLAPERIDLTKPIEYQVGKIGGKFGRGVRIPFRLLSAFDDFAKNVGGQAELHKLAYRRANGNSFLAQRIIEKPPTDIVEAVAQSRQERTFQNPHKLAQSLVRLRSEHKWLHVILPFLQTPANILKVSLERSPAGFYEGAKAYRAYREGLRSGVKGAALERLKGEAVDKLSRPLMGTLLIGGFTLAAKAGGMTGGGPVDKDEKNALLDSGWQPYSFVIPLGDGKKAYVPFNRFEPVSALLGFAADLSEITREKDGKEVFEKALSSVAQNLTNKSYLQGVSEAAAMINDPQGAGKAYIKNLAGSLVPNIVGKAAQATDSTFRETRATHLSGAGAFAETAGKTIASRLPGASMLLEPKRTASGEEAERPGNPLTRFALPSQVTTDKEGKDLEREMARIGYVPNPPGRSVAYQGKKYELSPEEYDRLHEADRRASEMARRAIKSPTYQNLPDTIEEGGQRSKEAILRHYFERARTEARKRLLPSVVRRQVSP